MFIRRVLGLGVAAILIAGLSGCSDARNTGTPNYLLPVLDSEGNTVLKDIPLATLSSPFSVDGAAASIYVDPDLSAGDLGKPAQVHVAKAGNTYIPLDPAERHGSFLLTPFLKTCARMRTGCSFPPMSRGRAGF